MSEYNAPLKDMLFVLNELVDLPSICALPGFEDSSADVIEAVLTEAGKLASEVLSPLNVAGDRQGTKVVQGQVNEADGFKDAYQQFIVGGWTSLPANPAYGGMGLPELIATTVGEMWSAANTSFALCPMLTQGAIGALTAHGHDDLKSTYLTKLVTGQWTGTMNLTEPQAGSDLSVVRTKAEPDGAYYRLFGTKIFITWGDHGMTDNIAHLVLARTPDAPEGVKGISLFLVPKYLVNEDGSLGERNDVFPVSVEHKMGIHGSPTCVMSFGGNQTVQGKEGAIGYLVGEENNGLVYMFTMMNHARLNVGAQGVALADRAYQHAVSYSKERVQGRAPGDSETGTIIRHPDVRRMLLLMRGLTEASRAVNYLAVGAYDKRGHESDSALKTAADARLELLTPIAKGWATEIAQEVTSLGVQIHGGMGFVEETGAAQFMRDARITSIYEGTTGIQANDLVGRKLIRDKGAEFKHLISDMRETQALLVGAGSATVHSALKVGIDQLEDLVQWVLNTHSSDPRLPGSVSFNLLMLAGTVTGGWLMAKSAFVAQTKHADDPDFYSAKLVTVCFYMEHIMPRAFAYAAAAKASSETLMLMDDEQF